MSDEKKFVEYIKPIKTPDGEFKTITLMREPIRRVMTFVRELAVSPNQSTGWMQVCWYKSDCTKECPRTCGYSSHQANRKRGDEKKISKASQ